MKAAAGDPLEVARRALAAAELRTGVRSNRRVTLEQEIQNEEGARPLAAVLDEGRLPAGAASVVAGSTSLLLALLAMAQGEKQWVAAAGIPDMGLLAAAEAGLALERVALVPRVARDGATVVAALLDGFDSVVVGPEVALTPAERRRLLARARERGSALVTTQPWEQASVRLEVVGRRWAGSDRGARHLHRCELDVIRTTRGTTDRWTLTLPAPGSPFIEPTAGQARPASTRGGALRLVG